jgi:putative DNA-invertase from lambdoid prophage Rac
MATYGYGRVSTEDQTTENQRKVVELQQKMQIDIWFEDNNVSGKVLAENRTEFAKMLSITVPGDTVVFTRVDRIGRKTSNILNTVEGLLEKGIEVFILQLGNEPLSSPMGKVMLGIFAIFAENERDSIVERTNAGITRTRAAGTKFGAPLKISPTQLREMKQQQDQGKNLNAIATHFKVSRNTVDRILKDWGDKIDKYEDEYTERKVQHKINKARKLKKG